MMAGDRVEKWAERWDKGRIGWHKKDVNTTLVHHGSLLLSSPHRRVLVPLCGKSVDLRWFYDEGHTVVGIEAVESAVLDFFSEQNLTYITEQLTWGKLFKTEDSRLSIYCSDMMEVDIVALGKFNAVWDRGALVAIYEEDRERYSLIMKSLLAPDFSYLLNVTQYTPNDLFNGPPRNIPNKLVEQLFGDKCKIQVLETISWPVEDERLGRWGVQSMNETTLILTPRN